MSCERCACWLDDCDYGVQSWDGHQRLYVETALEELALLQSKSIRLKHEIVGIRKTSP